MSRFARVVVPQCPHHVTQRGNGRRDVFFTASDHHVYLGILKQYAPLHEVDVLGYCLMTNHVHLVLLPTRAESLAKLMRDLQMRYSQYRHAVERGNGHLWQSRYYSCAVDPHDLVAVMRYVELNPVRAGMVAAAADYRWSSARLHLGLGDSWGGVETDGWAKCWTPQEWAQVLSAGEERTAAIRDATYGGRPLGSAEFVGQLEQCLGRSLQRGRPGRPKKEKVAAAGG